MKKTLIDVMFMSEKRKNTLLLLQEGAKEMEDLLRLLKTNRQSLLPQMRILEEHHLVHQSKDTYELTTIGKLIVNEMVPLVSTTEALDSDIDYWGTHNLDFIPHHLLERFDELNNCKVLKPHVSEMFEINKDFVDSAFKSSSINFISTITHPEFPSILSEFIRDNKKVIMVISKEVFDRIRKDWHTEFKYFLNNGGVKFYLSEVELKLMILSMTDSCFILRLLSNNKEFSSRQLIGNDPKSHQWSKDLFEHYLERSTLISQI